ncbi:hypothetical protein FDB75_16320 [Clostridium botulinum]|nr:hypothetical protein [Clostridium botulinum]NFO50290.1 hypothetical protein [Clostridium botulinum]
MENEFIELLEHQPIVFSANAINANEYITKEQMEQLSKINLSKLELCEPKISDCKDTLESVISNYKETCEIMKVLLENRATKVIPALYRMAMYYIVYRLYDITKKQYVQGIFLKDLDLPHNKFEKWNLRPIQDCKEALDWGENLNIKRDGKKNEILLYMLNEIVGRVYYKNAVDVFGGLGTVTAYMPVRKYTKRCINDFDDSVANFLGVIKLKPFELQEMCKGVIKDIEEKSDYRILEMGKKAYQERIDRIKAKKNSIEDLENAEDRKEIEYAMGLYRIYEAKLKEFSKFKESKDKNGYVINKENLDLENALAYYYIYSFPYNSSSSISGVVSENLRKFKKGINKISTYSERFINVKVTCCDFNEIICSDDINQPDTLLYVDSPYYRTKPYKIGDFSDEQHIQLHDALKSFKGKWVFSCRSTINKKYSYNGEVKINSILEYFEMYSDIGKYVLYHDKDKCNEVMITNFDFNKPDIRTYKFLKFKKYKNKYPEFKDSEFTKLSYDEFLNNISKQKNKM